MITQISVKHDLGKIESNLAEVEKSILQYTAQYRNYVVTEETLKDDKKLLAEIRAQKKNLDEERKKVKQAWNKPYESWERMAKRLLALYDDPIQMIDKQIKGFEEDQKKKKRELIGQIYESVEDDLKDWLPLQRIYKSEWENKTCAKTTILESIQESYAQLHFEVDSVKMMHSAYEKQALEVIKNGGSLQDAIAEINALTAADERAKKAAEERKAQEAAQAPKLPEIPLETVETIKSLDIEKEPQETAIKVTVTVYQNRLKELTDLLDENFFDYEF